MKPNHADRPITHGGTYFNSDIENAVVSVIQSGFVGEGDIVNQCVEKIKQITKRKYVLIVASGSEAIQLTLRSGGIKTGDKVGLPAFISAIVYNSIKSIGATPYPIDINPVNYTLDKKSLQQAIPNIQALIINHPVGYPDLESFNIPKLPKLVIEDCADALGISPFGSLGSVSIGSFYATKLIGGNWGGFIATDDTNLMNCMLDLKSPYKDSADTYRLHYKSNNIDCAIALVQLNRLSEIIEKRHQIAQTYLKNFKRLEDKEYIRLPAENKNRIWGRFIIQTDHNQELLTFLKSNNIIGNDYGRFAISALHYTSPALLPNFIHIKDKLVSIPLYPSLTKKNSNDIITQVQNFWDNVIA